MAGPLDNVISFPHGRPHTLCLRSSEDPCLDLPSFFTFACRSKWQKYRPLMTVRWNGKSRFGGQYNQLTSLGLHYLPALFWHHWPAKGASSMKTNMGSCIFSPCMIMFLSLLGHISRKSWGGTAISKVWGHKATCNPANPTSWRYLQHTWMSSGVFVQHRKWWKMLQSQIEPTNYFTGIIEWNPGCLIQSSFQLSGVMSYIIPNPFSNPIQMFGACTGSNTNAQQD